MAVQISRNSLQKLTNHTLEIRLRNLEQIESKFLRALAHNDEIEFKPVELCKQLIRWFGCQPLKEPKKVLNLLNQLLRSRYGAVVLKKLGLERLKRELTKVAQVIKGFKDVKPLLDELFKLVHDEERAQDINKLIETTESLTIQSGSSTGGMTVSDTSQSTQQKPVEVGESGEAYVGMDLPILAVDYEVAWSKPSAVDYNAMKLMVNVMANSKAADNEELENALQHLKITMPDYPAEYLLQAPHIYCNLLELYQSLNADYELSRFTDVAESLLLFLRQLKKRLTIRYSTLSYAMCTVEEELQGQTQLKLEKTLNLAMAINLEQLEQNLKPLAKETLVIFEVLYVLIDLYTMQHLCIGPLYVEKIACMLQYLQGVCENDEHLILARHKYLLLMDVLLVICENNASRQPLMHEIDTLKHLLCDYNLQMNFPQHYRRIKLLITNANPTLGDRYVEFGEYEKCFKTSIMLLKAPLSFKSTELLELGNAICKTSQTLQSPKLTELLFNALLDCCIYYAGNAVLKDKAVKLLMHLINLPHVELKAFVYNKLAMAIKKHFACLMNGEIYAIGVANSVLLDAQVIGLPWNTELLMDIIYEAFQTDNPQIKETGECILLLLLKAEHLLGKAWPKFMELLLPVMPLLQCFTDSPKLTERLMEIFNPDASQLPFPYKLRSNILFLFYKSSEVRSEALTRLLYMLQSLACAGDYVPNIDEIQDLLPNDLLLFETPKDFKYIFNLSENFADLQTLHNLLAILQSTDIEPLIRKTTLVQLNVLCQNWELLEAFCNDGAYYLILQTLESALKKESYSVYTDAVIPAVSILNKVLMFDVSLRMELAITPNIYMLLLRALFLYSNDIQMRQDATLCLFQLIFASFLHVDGEDIVVELPILLRNLQLPLKCTNFITKQTQTSNDTESSLQTTFNDLFATPEMLNEYLRFVIASSYVGDYFKLKRRHLEIQQQLDINSQLMLSSVNFSMIRCSMPAVNLKRSLQAAANATQHSTLTMACITLKTQLLLCCTTASSSSTPLSAEESSHELYAELYKLLAKYIHLPPGNEKDLQLYEELLKLCQLSIRLAIIPVIQGLSMSLQVDFQHAFITLLKDLTLPLRFYRRLCETLYHLLLSPYAFTEISPNSSSPTIFFSNLFDLIFEIATHLFEQRDLQRVRCLLSLLQVLSCRFLDMSDKLLGYYCKRFIRMSLALKSFTHTGAQWQRDCLLLVSQLYTQMDVPEEAFKWNANLLKYLSALCCHVDAEIRALAWTLLTNAANSACKEENAPAVFTLLSELAYLPGGFLACCLSTFLDAGEICLIRQLSGNLFVVLSERLGSFAETNKLLDKHDFYRQSSDALQAVTFDKQLPQHFNFKCSSKLSTTDLISCYCRIYITLIDLQPQSVQQLCEKPFMYKVYEIIKLPDSSRDVSSYCMCSFICQLYAKCYSENFPFLQRTLCRDPAWLSSFVQLLKAPSDADKELTNVLQLLLVVCKDPIAYQQVCELFDKQLELLEGIFRRALDIAHVDSSLQRATLALLTMLLIKGQYSEQNDTQSESSNFIDLLERRMELQSTSSICLDNDRSNKENVPAIVNKSLKAAASMTQLKSSRSSISDVVSNCSTVDSLSAYCFIELYRIFHHLYPTQACKFKCSPSTAQQQIAESLSVLLKFSTEAQQAASHLKFLHKILKILQSFFEDFNMSCTTFVRRYGDNKKQPIIRHFQLLTQLMVNWFSSPAAILKDEPTAYELTKILIQIWPWLAHSADLKLHILQLCAYLSERSLVVCQQFSTLIGSYSNSVLQLVHKIATHETSSIKAASTESSPTIAISVRLLMNCCACVEGRVTLVKYHVLDVFDGLHPFNLKSPKIKQDILHSWLEFWELFSRYTEGAAVRNLNALCGMINRMPIGSPNRLLSMKILRNMTFLSANRSALMVSTDFIYTINAIVSQTLGVQDDDNEQLSFVEQMLACVSIWKIVSGGVKYIAIFRGTKLAKQLQILSEQLVCLEDADPDKFNAIPYAVDLKNVLDIIFSIFNNH